MGKVLRQDLNRGQLLDLDDDLPTLLEATEATQTAIRNLVRDLRQSPLGPGGLFPTVRLLTSELEPAGSMRITQVAGMRLLPVNPIVGVSGSS